MNEIAETFNAPEVAVLHSLQTALEKGVDADSLDKILSMQERVMDRQAEQIYHQAMQECQAEIEVIDENKANAQTRSRYADLKQIVKTLKPIYTKWGFSLSFSTKDSKLANHIRIVCLVMHRAGHSKRASVDLPLDMSGIQGNVNKTELHGTASAFSYGQRYLIKLIFNVVTGDEDDDGNAGGGDQRSALEVENDFIKRITAWKDLLPSILQLKENIALNELDSAYEVWGELDEQERDAIWHPAPTKGGILTTHERTVMKSTEWFAIHCMVTGFRPGPDAVRTNELIAQKEKENESDNSQES